MLTNKFEIKSEDEFDVICNFVFVLPIQFDILNKVTNNEDDYLVDEVTNSELMCYYVMSSGITEEENVVFKNTNKDMNKHIKSLLVLDKVDEVGVNKVLVDDGAAVNLMPHFLLKKIGNMDTYLTPHNMVLSYYEGNTSKALGVAWMTLM